MLKMVFMLEKVEGQGFLSPPSVKIHCVLHEAPTLAVSSGDSQCPTTNASREANGRCSPGMLLPWECQRATRT